MKVLVISGFLGAGKTTFIKELANRTGRDIAIYENEYAAEGMDKNILESGLSNGDINIYETSNGCICCSEKGDFKMSVLTIANSVDPEILIVEPTGIGKLSNVMANVSEIEYERISLLKPVTIVDAGSIDHYLKDYDELYTDQVKNAAVIVISKQENLDGEERERIASRLRELNPDADIITEHYSGLDTDWFNGLFADSFLADPEKAAAEPEFTAFSPTEAGPLPESFSISGTTCPSLGYLVCFLEDLIRGEFGRIIRAKGHITLGGELLHFEVADRNYYIEGVESVPSEDAEKETIKPSAVFIGHDIERQTLRRKLFEQIKPVPGRRGIPCDRPAKMRLPGVHESNL